MLLESGHKAARAADSIAGRLMSRGIVQSGLGAVKQTHLLDQRTECPGLVLTAPPPPLKRLGANEFRAKIFFGASKTAAPLGGGGGLDPPPP